jgi:putative transposase
MGAVIDLAPSFGVESLCEGLGLSRATLYRRRQEAAVPASVVRDDDEQSGRQPVVALEHGMEAATVPPSATEEDTNDGAARRCCAEDVVRDEGAHALPQPHSEVAAPTVARKTSYRALSETERKAVLQLLVDEKYCDKSPAEIYASLLDEGWYYCSIRTMYRLLQGQKMVKERRAQRTHPVYTKPELMAEGPNQLWSWDITKLKTPTKGSYFHLYVVIDVFSRFVVGWLVADREHGELAKQLMETTYDRHGVKPETLTVHADNGAAMVSRPLALLFADLGVIKSHSRPHTSDDNPFSEAQFKTLKYRHDFPERFESLEHARAYLKGFFVWYNNEHHHGALALLTPADVHYGRSSERIDARAEVLNRAYALHPERFVKAPPRPKRPPKAVYINPPKAQEVQPPTPQ